MQTKSLTELVRRRSPETLPATASVQQACRVMRDKRIGAILVTEPDGGLAGIFTGRDAVARVLAEGLDPMTTPLRSVMTASPAALSPRHAPIDALRMMRDGGYRHVPLVDAAMVVGIVSSGDFGGLERARLDEETGYWEIL